MKKHILVIAQYFYPEQFRINDICLEWIKRGYQVTVITGIPNYPQGKYYKGYGLFKKRKESYNGINIIRIPLIPRGTNSVMLSLNYLSFVVSGFIWKLLTKIEADCVFIYETSPMTQALLGVWYADKRNIPCYLYVQDLWPENVEVITGLSNKYIIGSIGKMVDYIYSKCTKIFTTSNSFIGSIHKRGVTLNKLEYWPQYAEEFYINNCFYKEKNNFNGENFKIIFAGNVGKAQGLDVLVKTAEILENRKLGKEIIFNIVGDGSYKQALMNLIQERQLNHMFNFIPRQPAKDIPKLLSENDAAFLSLKDDPIFSMTIPAKVQSYMACGIPIIASAQGEVVNIINEAKAGVCSPAGDAEKLANNIEELCKKSLEELETMADNGRKYCKENFEKEKLLDVMDKYLRYTKELGD